LRKRESARPSTYASILSTLQDRKYIESDKRKRLRPSELGSIVSDLLVESFPGIMEVDFTAGLERSLDQVEEGKQDWKSLLKDFYGPFSIALKDAKTTMRQIKGKGVETDIDCPTCGKKMTIRLGRHGQFLACSGYPECKTTSDFTRDEKGGIVLAAPPEDPGIDCTKCGAPMQIKNGPYGPFLACSAYPACTNIMEIDKDGNPVEKKPPKKYGEQCPKCGGDLLIKPTRAGGEFISCSNYPKCRFSKGLPTGIKCPKCGSDLVQKHSRRGKAFFGCDAFPKCDYAIWDKPIDRPLPPVRAPLPHP
jgi:DNA topoisomerase-1